MQHSTELPSVVTIGAQLTIEGERRTDGPDSEGGTGIVEAVHADGTFNIRLTVGGVQKNVHPRRIQNNTPLATTARRRSSTNDDSVARPSLLSIKHVPSTNNRSSQADVMTIAANNSNDFKSMKIHNAILQCSGWHPRYSNTTHPLMDMLKWGMKQPLGWARVHDARVSGSNNEKVNVSKQLTPEQKTLLVNMKKETDRYAELAQLAAKRGIKGQGPIPMLQHAFAVGRTTVKDCVKKYNERGGETKRRKRSDAGKTLANSDSKRNQMCTAANYFKKLKRVQHPGEVLKNAELDDEFNNLSEEDQLKCAHGAESMKTMLSNLEATVKNEMQRANGCVSWERLAQHIAGGEHAVQPIGADALARWVMGTEGFRETQTLKEEAKAKRMEKASKQKRPRAKKRRGDGMKDRASTFT